MKTATLTILRRLLATALGALGLGAFAGGSANAQEIPAPNLFDGQVACSMNVPTPPMSLVGKDMAGMDIGITAKIASGMAIVVDEDDTNDIADGTPIGDDAALANILYVIDPMNGNCGAGTYTADEATAFNTANNLTGDDAVAEGDAKPIAAGIAADVGAGYSETLTAFQAVVDADADVEAKQMVLNGYLEDDTADVEQTTLITNARAELATSQDAQAEAHAALYAATGPDRDGSIYRAGVAEWRAKGAVESAITAWNTAVGELATADSALTTSTQTFADYVPLQNSGTTAGQILSLIADPAMADSAVNLANLRTYANAAGGGESSQDSMTGTITGTSNFDAAGNLLIPLSDGDSDAATPITPTTSAQTYSVINTQLTQVNNVVTALEKLQGENKNALFQPIIDEAVRRAKLEQAHFQAQFDKVVADNTDFNTDGDDDPTTMPESFKRLYDAVRTATTKRDNAGVALETAVQTREAATAAVRTAFTNPQSFYQQLVDRRQYVKDQRDAEVTRLAGLTGDDAPTQAQTDAAAEAASDAQEALDAATATLESFQGLIAEDSPVRDLVLETLKPDLGMGQGDDGQALVDAIAGAYADNADVRTTAENAETAATEAGNAVAALTAMDDPDTADVDETGAVTANTNAIADIRTDIEGLTGDGGQVSTNTADIEALDGRVATNEGDIAALDGRVTTNEADISALDGRVTTNEGDIAALDGRVTANEGNIADNTAAIGVNEGNIAANKQAIADEETARMEADTMLMGHITTNAGNIMDNANNIAANAGNIMTNAEAIGTNAGNIATNAADIMTNAGNIAANNMYIMENRGMIEANAGMIGANASAIGANTAAIAAANSRIDANAMAVRELREDMSGGIAAAMALAGMPEIGDRGVSVGAGSYDGESAVAVGVHFSGENSRFKAAITSGGGETGVSVGAGWSF